MQFRGHKMRRMENAMVCMGYGYMVYYSYQLILTHFEIIIILKYHDSV